MLERCKCRWQNIGRSIVTVINRQQATRDVQEVEASLNFTCIYARTEELQIERLMWMQTFGTLEMLCALGKQHLARLTAFLMVYLQVYKALALLLLSHFNLYAMYVLSILLPGKPILLQHLHWQPPSSCCPPVCRSIDFSEYFLPTGNDSGSHLPLCKSQVHLASSLSL